MRTIRIIYGPFFACIVLLLSFTATAHPWDHGKLVINRDSKNPQLDRRFLQHEDGTPFFWLGDTAWGIFRNSFRDPTPEQGQPHSLDEYFATRSAQGFNVVQTQLLPLTEISDNRTPGTPDANINAYGETPFAGGNTRGDFTRPILHEGKQRYGYWDHVDHVVQLAVNHGMYLAIVPAWNNHLPETNPPSVVTDTSVAYRYGHFLGQRFADRPNIIWMLGGDAYSLERKINTPFKKQLKDMNFAMAEGIADGTNGVNEHDGKADYRSTLMTLHPRGGRSSKELKDYRQAAWMDFDSIQTALSADKLSKRNKVHTYTTVTRDYNRVARVRPTLEAEVSYEHSARSFIKPPRPVDTIPTTPWEARRSGYLAVFSGSMGYTYGHINLIHFLREGQNSDLGANRPWYDSLGIELDSRSCPEEYVKCKQLSGSLSGEASNQLLHLRKLIESRYLADAKGNLIQDRVPDQEILTEPYRRLNRFMRLQAMRSSHGRYVMVYTSNGSKFGVDMSKLAGTAYNAWWYNPRDGKIYMPDGSLSPGNSQPFLACSTNHKNKRIFNPPGKESPDSEHVRTDPPELQAVDLFRDQSIGNDWVLVLDDAEAGLGVPGMTDYGSDSRCDGIKLTRQ